MSTLFTFGYVNGAPGSKNATPVQAIVLDEGQTEWDNTDPNYSMGWPALYREDVSVPANVVLAVHYWPAALPSIFYRDPDLPFMCTAGRCIRVSRAEYKAIDLCAPLQMI